jgi:hypothetical protein
LPARCSARDCSCNRSPTTAVSSCCGPAASPSPHHHCDAQHRLTSHSLTSPQRWPKRATKPRGRCPPRGAVECTIRPPPPVRTPVRCPLLPPLLPLSLARSAPYQSLRFRSSPSNASAYPPPQRAAAAARQRDSDLRCRALCSLRRAAATLRMPTPLPPPPDHPRALTGPRRLRCRDMTHRNTHASDAWAFRMRVQCGADRSGGPPVTATATTTRRASTDACRRRGVLPRRHFRSPKLDRLIH